jgi:succinoglycan biosynthesis transport protein ExoP
MTDSARYALPEWTNRPPDGDAPLLSPDLRDDRRRFDVPNDRPASSSMFAYGNLLWRKRRVLIYFGAGGLCVALLFSMLQKPFYRARTVLEIQDLNENFLNIEGQDPTAASSGSSTAESYIQTQINVLQSRALLERVTTKLGMKLNPSSFGLAQIWRKAPPKDDSALLDEVMSHLTVRAVGETHDVEILFDSDDPRLAANFCNTLLDEFASRSREMRWDATQKTSEWLTGHLAELKAKLDVQEAELQRYTKTSGLVLAGDSGKEDRDVSGQKLLEIQDELSKVHALRTQKQASYEAAQSAPVDSLAQILDDPTIRDYQEKLTDLRRQLAELSTTMTPGHYRVQQVQAQISEMEGSLNKQRNRMIERLKNEYQEARRREDLLTASYQAQAVVVSDSANKTIHYTTLKNELETTRSLYDALMQRVKQAGLAAAMRASNVLAVDPARPPLLPYRPNYKLNTAIGTFAGLMLGLWFVILRQDWNHSIYAPGIAPTYLNLPELGVIPRIDAGKNRALSSLLKRTDPANATDAISPLTDTAQLTVSRASGLTTLRTPSSMAEAFRATLTSILLPNGSRNRPRLIVITSPAAAAGKTTVATNLSVAMAEIGRRVLLVDGDLRRPRLHRLFGVSNEQGFADVLAGSEPSWLTLMCSTQVPGLFLLPSGRIENNLSSLLHSPQLNEFYAEVRAKFDLVLIDAPPALPVFDARLLARSSDGVIVVIRAGQTTPEAAQLVCQRFTEDGTHVFGTILNSWDLKDTGYGYGGEYDAYLPVEEPKNGHSSANRKH